MYQGQNLGLTCSFAGMDIQRHALSDELVQLGIIDMAAVTPYYPCVRDRADVAVLRCGKSGLIFLSRIDHVAENYYSDQDGLSYWSEEGREAGLLATREDDERRAAMMRPLVKGKVFADVGTGLGGILDLLKADAKELHAVEPQRQAREMLQGLGYSAHASAAELASSGTKCDVITLFHVFEHLLEPMSELKDLYEALAPGGKLIIEVPHAKDALLSTYDLEAFKAFTFWSEHLILHTRESLSRYLSVAGFTGIEVRGVQRYPLANHLYWLRHGKPGGQSIWPELNAPESASAYARMLENMDRTDTLVAVAQKT